MHTLVETWRVFQVLFFNISSCDRITSLLERNSSTYVHERAAKYRKYRTSLYLKPARNLTELWITMKHNTWTSIYLWLWEVAVITQSILRCEVQTCVSLSLMFNSTKWQTFGLQPDIKKSNKHVVTGRAHQGEAGRTDCQKEGVASRTSPEAPAVLWVQTC